MRDYDTNPIIVETYYTFDAVKKFNLLYMRGSKRVSLIFLVIFGLFTFLLSYGSKQIDLGITFWMFWVFLFFFLENSGIFFTQKTYEKYRHIHGEKDITYFSQNNYHSESPETGTFNARYSNVQKVIETPDWFFIFLAPNMASIVSKNGFQGNDTPIELRELLKAEVQKYSYVK